MKFITFLLSLFTFFILSFALSNVTVVFDLPIKLNNIQSMGVLMASSTISIYNDSNLKIEKDSEELISKVLVKFVASIFLYIVVWGLSFII